MKQHPQTKLGNVEIVTDLKEGSGLVATKDLEENSEFLRIPYDLMMSNESAAREFSSARCANKTFV